MSSQARRSEENSISIVLSGMVWGVATRRTRRTKLKVTAKDNTAKDNKDAFISDYDLYLFGEGNYLHMWEKLGAHLTTVNGKKGTHFAVWAPNATRVSVVGDFNNWNADRNVMKTVGDSGVWACFIEDLKEGTLYKYKVENSNVGYSEEKVDPVGFYCELRPKTASIVHDIDTYEWKDERWGRLRDEKNSLNAPISIYEVHLGSWMRVPDDGNRWMTYRELADKLVDYVKAMNFTHVELLPLSEHPLDASWGYQPTGYFAATSRFGKPEDLMYLVDKCHQNEIGVILDWVPGHFSKDGHGLGIFDGTHLYEHADSRKKEHKEWGTYIFNYGRNEVRNFLISNALFWFEKFHVDGLRVDAVASMLYLDYARKDGEWVPNQYGGRENLEAIDFLRKLNETIYGKHPYAIMVAEESTSWPGITKPTYLGGLGFNLKWDMGWMNDTLRYMSKDPVHRVYHHNTLTFRGLYHFSENFCLPLSHDEVVHGKASIVSKMPGDDWQKFANARLLYAYQSTLPGKKLLFMGSEFGQWIEWRSHESLDWHLLEHANHEGLRACVRDLNRIYSEFPELHELDCQPEGFQWIDCNDHEQSILCYLRKAEDSDAMTIVCLNFTPVPRNNYRVGVPHSGLWKEVLNTDAIEYGGSGLGNEGQRYSEHVSCHGHNDSILVTLPPLSAVIFRCEPGE